MAENCAQYSQDSHAHRLSALRRADGLGFVAAGWRAVVLFGACLVAFVNGLQALILLAVGS